MKRLATMILLTWSVVGYGQEALKYENGMAHFRKVIEVEGKVASYIYKQAYKWVALTYKNPEAVLKAQIENELIKGHGSDVVNMPGIVPLPTDYRYAFTIEIKDGRARITIDEIVIGLHSIETYCYKKDGSERTGGQARGLREGISEDANRLISSLENYLVSPTSADDDW